jgi:CBS-domain-containing membrane protein
MMMREKIIDRTTFSTGNDFHRDILGSVQSGYKQVAGVDVGRTFSLIGADQVIPGTSGDGYAPLPVVERYGRVLGIVVQTSSMHDCCMRQHGA